MMMMNDMTKQEHEQWTRWKKLMLYGTRKQAAWATEQMDRFLQEYRERKLGISGVIRDG